MKSYGALAGRYLKQQRRRTVLTIVGIILSVALICALGTMGQSMKDNMISQTVHHNGAFQIGFSEATPALYEQLQGNALLAQVGAVRKGDVTLLQNAIKLYLTETTTPAFDLMPVHLQDGRLPHSPDEVIVEEWVLPSLPGTPKLGGQTELTMPNGEKHSYTIVGTLENQKSTQLSGGTTAFTFMEDPETVTANTTLQILAIFKHGVDISSHVPEFEKLSKAFFTNSQLLALQGESPDSNINNALFLIFGILIGLVVLSTIAVIYNAFNIAVLERMRHFGLLRTIGATPRQIRNLVFREAGVLAVLGIPLGLVVGYGALWLVLKGMSAAGFSILMFEGFELAPHTWIIAGSAVVGLAAVFLAAWLPARKAGRVSPVDAVKGAGSIVRETYKRVRIPSLLNLFGIEGNMASKNIRRNRSKFRITAFSIVVSVMLFIVFHYFTQEAFKLTVTDSRDDQIAFQLRHSVNFYDDNGNFKAVEPKDALSEEAIQQIAALPGVDNIYRQYNVPDGQALIPADRIDSTFAGKMALPPKQMQAGVEIQPIYTSLKLYDDARLKQAADYLLSGTADPAKLAADNAVLIVQKVNPFVQSDKKKVMMDIANLKVGDTLSIDMGNGKDASLIREVKIGGILSQSPFSPTLLDQQLAIFGTKTTIVKLLQGLPAESAPYGTSLTGIEVSLADGAADEPVRQALQLIVNQTQGMQLIDVAAQQKDQRQFNLQMQIFVYGFLIVIGLIGSLNIINTVQTNLLLRRRELGLLQAVGMTMGQLRRMASLEGVWFGVIGSFWGLILGTGVSYFLYQQLNGVQGMPFEFPWTGALIACGFALGVGLLSVQGPLRRMAKTNLIEELREEV